MKSVLRCRKQRLPGERPTFGVCCVSALTLLWVPPQSRLAAQETSMVFIESPTLHATFVQTPEGYDPEEHRTVVVALHGFGSTAERFFGLAPPFTSAGIIFASVRAPYAFTYEDGRLGYDWSLRHLRQGEAGDRAEVLTLEYIASVLAGLRERYRADRVFLLGFSQGGAFAYMSAIANHATIDGLVIFGAGFDETWFPTGGLAEGKDLPVFIAHGETDESVSISESEEARDILRASGYDVTYRPFTAGHSVPLDILAEVATWIANR
jgi:phospholipase/carboxylesterase